MVTSDSIGKRKSPFLSFCMSVYAHIRSIKQKSRNQTNIRGLNLNGSQHKDHSHHIQYPETSGSSLQDLVTTTIRLLINPQPVYRREVQAI